MRATHARRDPPCTPPTVDADPSVLYFRFLPPQDKKDKKDKESKKEKKEKKTEATTPAKGGAEEKEFDYDACLKKCTVISKPMASEKLTKKVLKATKKGMSLSNRSLRT